MFNSNFNFWHFKLFTEFIIAGLTEVLDVPVLSLYQAAAIFKNINIFIYFSFRKKTNIIKRVGVGRSKSIHSTILCLFSRVSCY